MPAINQERTTTIGVQRRLRSIAISPSMLVAALIVLLPAAWLACEFLSHGHAGLHEDMTEAYVWGRHFQLGYYKHPPFWSWIAGAWLVVFPRTTIAFMALSAVNIGLGLWGAWKLNGQFVSGETRLAAFTLLLVTPLYCFLAFRFNANTIFVSLWPWTAYFLVRSLDERRAADGILFGLLAAADILSKYFAGVLLLTCALALLVHPGRAAYLKSRMPWLSIAAAGPFVVLPDGGSFITTSCRSNTSQASRGYLPPIASSRPCARWPARSRIRLSL
jgi:4-amino-4-deoxy-L-arabinose transferase-like glycosyltransferase